MRRCIHPWASLFVLGMALAVAGAAGAEDVAQPAAPASAETAQPAAQPEPAAQAQPETQAQPQPAAQPQPEAQAPDSAAELDLAGEYEAAEAPDPLEPSNRAVFGANEAVYHYLFDPLADGYAFVVPKPVRRSVRHFFDNLGEPAVVLNELMQMNPVGAGTTTARFAVNTTVGV